MVRAAQRGDTTLAGLEVDADHSLVRTAQVTWVHGQIRRLTGWNPQLLGPPGMVGQALGDGVLTLVAL
jgi:hypothetical protein